MKKIRLLFLFCAFVVLYFFFYPVPFEPKDWKPPLAPSLTGKYQKNTLLKQLNFQYKGSCLACEDIAVDSLGRIYGGNANGEIIRFSTSGNREVFANTEGRPLGMHFDQKQNLLVADAEKGLIQISPNGTIQLLANEFAGRPFGITDDLEIGKDGKIYFSDATYKFPLHDYKIDLLEHGPNGRFFVYDPEDGTLDLLIDSLFFANGVAVSHDQSFVLVVETASYRVRRHWVSGPMKGQTDMFIENLPGFPDGISQGSDGIFWLTLVSPRNNLLDNLMNKPFLRKILWRLPTFMQPGPERYGFILGLNTKGEVVYNLQDPSGKFAQITSVQEFNQKLYLGSLLEDGIGVFDLKYVSH